MTEEELRQMNLERLKNYKDALYVVILERYKILPFISTLSAALVGLVIQGTDFVKIKSIAFISFVFLLILIPISVFGILYQLGRDAEHLAGKIENILQPTKPPREMSNFMNIFPWIIYVLFLISIVLFVLSFFNLQ